ncbi:MAG: PatU [Cyanobacteria bacterium J06639_18]
MNRDSESLQHQILCWLLSNDNLTGDNTSVECKGNNGLNDAYSQAAAFTSGAFESELKSHNFKLGEIPTVQERFQAVLKRRLKNQIQSRPPLFPWESSITDYPEYIDNAANALVPCGSWVLKQSKLNLPIALPENIFSILAERCQTLVASSLPLGTKLVQAVENLFPEEPQALNDLAGLVLRTPYRSVDTLEVVPNLENNYSDLQQSQKMALSLLAAKELLENMTLKVSTTHPTVEREWETTAGLVNIRVEYKSQAEDTKLCIEYHLPAPSTLKLVSSDFEEVVHSVTSGCLSIDLKQHQLDDFYTLELDCPEFDQKPLFIAILTIV